MHFDLLHPYYLKIRLNPKILMFYFHLMNLLYHCLHWHLKNQLNLKLHYLLKNQ